MVCSSEIVQLRRCDFVYKLGQYLLSCAALTPGELVGSVQILLGMCVSCARATVCHYVRTVISVLMALNQKGRNC